MSIKDKSLNETLADMELTTRKAGGIYRKHIIDTRGVVLFTGTAHDVWEWLRGNAS